METSIESSFILCIYIGIFWVSSAVAFFNWLLYRVVCDQVASGV